MFFGALEFLCVSHQVGQMAPVVEAADLEGQVFPVSFGGFQVGEVCDGLVEPAGVEGVFCFEIVFPGAFVVHAVDVVHDGLEGGEFLHFFSVLSGGGVIHGGEGGAAETKAGRPEFFFCPESVDSGLCFGAAGNHFVQVVEGCGAFQKIHGHSAQGVQSHSLDAGQIFSIGSLKI